MEEVVLSQEDSAMLGFGDNVISDLESEEVDIVLGEYTCLRERRDETMRYTKERGSYELISVQLRIRVDHTRRFAMPIPMRTTSSQCRGF
jgi:hypothetical protein